ncbi:uncharacterized protein BYT42DRAFT_588820 [Radiomyces spectabilis]|uniref:uncharacterized protein n=1 Tax=Radiomyces spectabilis TaxID=64574 RepID=UPI0022204E1A|nr:uncharacterized protein BYT42DRAFT_588820 [Radiomyces spectabilis]KAI8366077.1 hypothetical protein BYT42DRAFT_588820 [Radiomyces spectabilis]
MRTLEDAIISETQLLIDNITKLNQLVTSTNDTEIIHLIDKLRRVEKKMSLVFLFFKASMYSNNIRQLEESYPGKVDETSGTNRPVFR